MTLFLIVFLALAAFGWMVRAQLLAGELDSARQTIQHLNEAQTLTMLSIEIASRTGQSPDECLTLLMNARKEA